MQTLRIFVSSPADVSFERARAKQVVEKLGIEFAGRVKLEPFFWEHEPMRATDTFNGKNNIPLTSDFDIVVCILWSRLGSLLGDAFRRPDGSRYPSGTVYEMEIARESYLRSKAPDLLVYRKTEELSLPLENKDLREQKLQQFEALEEFIQEWFFDKDNTFKSALTSYKKVSQFENFLEQHLRRLIELKLEKMAPAPSDGAVDGRVGYASYHGGSPFRGLEPFDFADSGLFFGRSLAIEEVLDALRKQSEGEMPLVVVSGVSGSGKSSLVRAGVVPVLMQPGVAEGIGLWRRTDMRPSDAAEGLFAGLAKALLEKEALPELARNGWDAGKLAKALSGEPEKVVVAIAESLKQASADVQSDEALPEAPASKLLLVLDQFEEVFSDERKISAGERKAFEDTLAALLKSGVVWGIMTMRSDRMSKFQELEKISEATRQHGQVTLMAPSETDLSLMIRLPARAAGLDFEQLVPSGERLEDRLLREARGAPDGLPLLGFVLQSLYERMEKGRRMLTFAALEELGGLEGAVASRAEAAFSDYKEKLGESGAKRADAALSRLMRLLTTLSEDPDAPPLRRVAEMNPRDADPERGALVEALVENRLLTRAVSLDGVPTVYVSHEAIFRKWPRLAELIERDRKFLETRRIAQGAAARWEARGRKGEFLWNRGAMLGDVKFLLENADTLDSREKDFAESSVASAKKRTLRNGLLFAGTAAAGVVAFFLMPEKIVKKELSQADKDEIRRVETRKKLDSLEEQLAAAIVQLDKQIWPQPEVYDENEEWKPESTGFPEMDVAEISRRIIELEPGNVDAWEADLRAEIVAAGRMAKDDPEEGERMFKELEKRFGEWKSKGLPTDELLNMKAQIAWQQDDRGGAANLWTSYLKTEGLEPLMKARLYDVLSANRIEEEKMREAGTLLDDWLQLEDNAVARARRAKIRLSKLDFKGAQRDLAKALDLAPDLVEVRNLVPVVERSAKYAGEVAEATAAIDKAGKNGGIIERCVRAKHLIAMEQFGAARDDLREAGKRVRGGSRAVDILLGLVTVRSGNLLEDESRVSPWSEWSNERGCIQYLDQNWSNLMDILAHDQMMWVTLGRSQRLVARGWAEWSIGQNKLSLDDANAALKENSGDGEAKMLRVASLIFDGDPETGLAECNEALKQLPAWAGFHRFKAQALAKLDRVDEALPSIEEACRLAPNVPLFHELRAQCLDHLGRQEEAATARKAGLELNNN